MRGLLVKAGLFGTASAALGALFWSHKKGQLNPKDEYELKLVQIMFRHGARTPLKTIPDVMQAHWVPKLLEVPPHTHMNHVVTDLDGGPRPPAALEDNYRKTKLSGGSFAGQLTTVGMEQLYDFGCRLRRRYVQERAFLSPSFNPEEVHVRSTNINRTIESARCLLAGLFDQQQDAIIPIKTTRAETEYFYPNHDECMMLAFRYGHRWEEASLVPEIAADQRRILGAMGVSPHHPIDFTVIRDDMVAREVHGLPAPPVLASWRDVVEQRAVDIMYYVFDPENRENLQLTMGPVMHTLVKNMEDKLSGSPPESNRKLYLYSSHDTTIIPFLMALGLFDSKWPPFAADVILELYKSTHSEEAFVKLSYTGQDQYIPGCSGIYCPLEEFKQVAATYSLSPDSHQNLCNSVKR